MEKKAEEDPRLQTLEARALIASGYGHHVLSPVRLRGQVVEGVFGYNFLAAYGADSPHRQETEELLEAFVELLPDDPDYADTREYVGAHFQAYFEDAE